MLTVIEHFNMTILEMDSEVCSLRAEEERILASFTQRLIEIAAVSGAPDQALPRPPHSMRCGCPRSHSTSTDLSPT